MRLGILRMRHGQAKKLSQGRAAFWQRVDNKKLHSRHVDPTLVLLLLLMLLAKFSRACSILAIFH